MNDIKYLNYNGLSHIRTKYISKIQNDLSKVSSDLDIANQSIEDIEQKLNDTNSLTVSQLSSQLSSVFCDIAKLSFQLDIKEVLDTSDLTHVIVDEIDSEDSVVILSGKYGNNKVYI